jgi:hypothetical protein
VLKIEAKDCLFVPFMTVVRDDQMVTVVNMDPIMHDIQAFETSHLGPRVLFNVPLPMNRQHPTNFKDRSDAGMYHKHMAGVPMKQLVNLSKGRRIFVMQCGFHAYMESWGLAVANPYFAKTDEQGRFTITDDRRAPTSWSSGILMSVAPSNKPSLSGRRGRWRQYRRPGPEWAALRQRGAGSCVHPLQRDRGDEERNRSDDPEAGSLNGASLAMQLPAPAGRLYADQTVDHSDTRYRITDEVRSQIVPTLIRQER